MHLFRLLLLSTMQEPLYLVLEGDDSSQGGYDVEKESQEWDAVDEVNEIFRGLGKLCFLEFGIGAEGNCGSFEK